MSDPQDDRKVVAKANEFIVVAPRPGSPRLTLLTRRIYNALLYHARKQPRGDEYYQIPLAELIRDAAYGDSNTGALKAHLRAMQQIVIDWAEGPSGRQVWTSTHLLGSVIIREFPAPQPTLLQWTYPREVLDRLLDPRQKFTRLMLDEMASYTTHAALALWELGRSYESAPGGLTMRMPLERWFDALTGGRPRKTDKPPEYRFFKRDVLRPALAQIDAYCESFQLELVEHKQGNKVVDLQFRVVRRSQQQLAVSDQHANPFPLDLVHDLVKLGFAQEQAQALVASEEEQGLRTALELTVARMRSARHGPLKSPVAYFRDALKNGYGERKSAARQEAPPVALSPEVAVAQLKSGWANERTAEARALWQEMSVPDQKETRAVFERDVLPRLLPVERTSWEQHGPTRGRGADLFFEWFANYTWPDTPTEAALLEFAARKLARLG